MKRAVILHGTLGSPEGNWFRWLQGQLEALGIQVWLPSLPQPEQPSLQKWASYVAANCPFTIDSNTLLIGHSSGAITALIVAQNSAVAVGGLAAVSVFCDNSLGWEPNSNLFDAAFDWQKIRSNVKQFLFIHSDNDPYVPLAKAQFVANNCGGELLIIKGQGHFNLEQSPDYVRFDKLLQELKERNFV